MNNFQNMLFLTRSKYLRYLKRCNCHPHRGGSSRPRLLHVSPQCRGTTPPGTTLSPKKMRVFGIMAHIDAGKTTTTERMLYYSGFQQTIGEVHHGDTTMDYLEQERQRGITIQSAAVTFPWRDHTLQLVDTPGHVDFTMEVERCLRVMDGAVTVLDASAGVEAQTVTVWQQADRYGVPRICYLNKMDKPAASHTDCIQDIKHRLGANTLLMQVPIGSGKQFRGVVDVISGRKLEWPVAGEAKGTGDRGATYTISPDPITASSDPDLYPAYTAARADLCDKLADHDNSVAEHILETEQADSVPSSLLGPAVRRCTIQQSVVPVLLGSSYRNVGVQPLMDAVLHYLPSPLERPPAPAVALYAPHLCALAFKIIFDPQRGGILVFVRVYSGTLEQGGRIYNVTRRYMERPTKMYVALADDFKETNSAGPGTVVVVAGLKKTKTGDTIVANLVQVQQAKEKLSASSAGRGKNGSGRTRGTKKEKTATAGGGRGGAKEEEGGEMTVLNEQEDNEHLLLGVKVPDPVFFCSIEAAAPRFQKPLEDALSIMQREDPSLTVKMDDETGQLVVGGMGELHLEVVQSRLQSQHGVEGILGLLQVAYREQVSQYAEETVNIDKTIGDTRMQITMTLALEPTPGVPFNKVGLLRTKDNGENLSAIRHSQLSAVTSGARSATSCGPILSCPVHGLALHLKWLTVSRRTTDAFLAAVAGQCVRKLVTESGCQLSEPVMQLVLTVDTDHSQPILADLNKRRAQLEGVVVRGDQKHIKALVPLAELVGYSSSARRLSSGRASFTLELKEYQPMAEHDQREAVRRVTGF